MKSGVEPTEGISPSLLPSVKRGLDLLLQGHQYARELSRDAWDFAVEIDELRREGMTINDFRWLVVSGMVEHASEVTPHYEFARKFKESARQTFLPRTCFILTAKGVALAQSELPGELSDLVGQSMAWLPEARPVWDAGRHQLTLHGRVVKRFRQHSPNQEAVLTAFHEEDWPPGILDPLRPLPNQDPKQRLRDTIKNLNRHQIEPLIHFSGDGTGERILWEIVNP
jgi:hypothetical protein